MPCLSNSTTWSYLLHTYVLDGFTSIDGGDVLFAGAGTGEKGYLDVRIEVSTPGGHSSVPPRHTVRIVTFVYLIFLDNC